MSMFSRLALGTANFGKEYNGVKVSKDEQKKILDYCQCSGIDLIDTSMAYGWDWTKANSYFHISTKGDGTDLNGEHLYAYIIHTGSSYYKHEPDIYDMLKKLRHKKLDGAIEKIGLSLYPDLGFSDDWDLDIIQAPYSIFDRSCEPHFPYWKSRGIEIHVRSIFLRGKILEKFKPWECIAFCLANPCVDRVIIGVDSLQQLRDNLRLFHRMNSSEVHDWNILDPRKWEGTK